MMMLTSVATKTFPDEKSHKQTQQHESDDCKTTKKKQQSSCETIIDGTNVAERVRKAAARATSGVRSPPTIHYCHLLSIWSRLARNFNDWQFVFRSVSPFAWPSREKVRFGPSNNKGGVEERRIGFDCVCVCVFFSLHLKAQIVGY